MSAAGSSTSSIQICLERAMKQKENIKKFVSVYPARRFIVQESFFSEIKPMKVKAEKEDGTTVDYNLVVKRGKTDNVLREKSLLRNLYEREILFYTQVLPKFLQFEHGKEDVDIKFDNVPKCFGTYMDDDSEAIVVDDLDNHGYKMIQKLYEPVDNTKFKNMLETLAKWHAISAAMNAQQQSEYMKIVEKLDNPLAAESTSDGIGIYTTNMRMIYEHLLESQLNDSEKEKWQALQGRIDDILRRVIDNDDGFKVVIHGDLQISNFMFKDSKPAILDWQFAALNNPAYDIADLVYTCAAEEDMSDASTFLQAYHGYFCEHLEKLGVREPSSIYTMAELDADWKNVADYGLMKSFTIMKNTFCPPNTEVVESAQKRQKLADPPSKLSESLTTMTIPDANKQPFTDRVLYIFRSAINHGAI